MSKWLIALLGFTLSMPVVMAENVYKPAAFSVDRMYFGGGFSYNTLSRSGMDYDSTTGYQLMMGYDLGMRIDKLHVLVEAGYDNAGDYEDKAVGIDESVRGPWVSGGIAYQAIPRLDLYAHVGVDSGDENGARFGGGVGYWVTKHFGVRGGLVVHGDIDALQVNFLYQP